MLSRWLRFRIEWIPYGEIKDETSALKQIYLLDAEEAFDTFFTCIDGFHHVEHPVNPDQPG